MRERKTYPLIERDSETADILVITEPPKGAILRFGTLVEEPHDPSPILEMENSSAFELILRNRAMLEFKHCI